MMRGTYQVGQGAGVSPSLKIPGSPHSLQSSKALLSSSCPQQDRLPH